MLYIWDGLAWWEFGTIDHNDILFALNFNFILSDEIVQGKIGPKILIGYT